MIGSTRAVRVFAYTLATDMRKGMDGLYGLVTGLLVKDPLSGDLFLFVSRVRIPTIVDTDSDECGHLRVEG